MRSSIVINTKFYLQTTDRLIDGEAKTEKEIGGSP